ncbi:MAG: tetratricopeptide repeat protein [Usitatibacter sp.]
MAKTLSTAATARAPPPFWQQLPQVFKYPAHADALVKIFAFSIAVYIAEAFLPMGFIFGRLAWLAFLAYCFGILERTARGHLTAAEVFINDRTDRDYRPILQVVIFIIFMSAAILAGNFLGPVAGQVALFVVALCIPASIMVLALDERLGSALNPLRLVSTIAGIGLPYLALCAFLFLLLESSEYLADGLDLFLPEWAAEILADVVSMYFMVSMYYLMGYVLYQNHEALGVDVHVDPAKAQQALQKSGGKVEPEILGPETRDLIADGKLDEAASRIEDRMRREWDNNKLHDQYQKLLLLQRAPKAISRHVNEYVPKLMREKKAARAVEVYETARKVVPDLLITDSTIILPLAAQASELRRDATAFELLKGFDKRFPDSADIPGVYMLAAKILLEKQNDFAMAQKIFLHLVKKFPQHPLAAEATRLAEVAGKMAASPAA